MIYRDTKGFTLIELLVSIAIASIMGGLIASSLWEQQKSHTNQLETSAIQQTLRAGFLMAAREIRLAGFQPHVLDKADIGITVAQADSLTFSYLIAADSDGEVDDTQIITFSLYDAYGDGDTDLGRNDGIQRALAENIDGLEFLYTLEDDTQTTTPSTQQLEEIRAIRMTILARTENPLRAQDQIKSFTTPSGATWGPYNDSYRRMMLSTSIICRNIGI